MSTPLEAQPKKESRIEDPPEEVEEDHAANEAVEGLEQLTRTAAAKREEIASLPSQEALLGQLADPNAIQQTEAFKRESGYTVNAGRDANGNVVRITETDGTEWNRSADGKSLILKQTGEKIPVKDVKFEQDGTYTLVMPDGRQMKRNPDRSVSMLDANGNETKRMNNDGTQLLFDEKHRVTASIDASGAKRGYGYESDGRLASIVEPDGSTWRSSDGKNWTNEKTRQNRSGEISVAQDGAQTVKNARGETTTFKMDGSTVSRDKDGNVVAVKDKAGAERRFTYDANKKLNGVQEPDGSVWRTQDGKTWQQEGTRNSAKLEISVDADGTVREKYPGGKEVAKRSDGWNEVKEGDKTRLERTNRDGSQVTKNALDQVTQIVDARGKARKFEYDDQGRMSKMTDSTGTWTSKDGQNWTNEKTKESWKGRLEANEEGLYREVSADGSKRVFKPDGSTISVDKDNRISRVEASNGIWRQFDYGQDGKISKVTESTGAKWSTTDGTNWTKEGSNETRKMNVLVRPDGTYQENDLATGNRRIGTTDGRNLTFDKNSTIQRADNADGSSTRFEYGDNGKVKGFEVKNKDGSQVSFDPQGRVVRTQSADNQVREFKYGTNGKLSEIKEADGKVWTSKDGENWESNKGDKSKGAAWVTPDGNYNYIENNTVVTKQLDGNTRRSDLSGVYRVENKAGQVVETLDSKGVKRTFAYGADGNVNRMTEGDASWETKDGKNWTNTKDGSKWQGTVKVEKDGTYYQEDTAGNKQWRKMDGSRQDVNYKAMEAAADALETAMNEGFMWGAGTDKDTVYATLENKTAAERQMIRDIWDKKHASKYGANWNLEKEFADEMKGSDLEKAMSLLNRPDGADNAGTIRQALVERGETFGRSNSELEKIVRNTLETMSAAEIAQTDAEYRRRYGHGLNDAIQNDPNLSAATKDVAKVYIKGHDNRTPEETKQLALNAVNAGNAEMFQESMRRAPKEVRDYFTNGEGKDTLKKKFEGGVLNFLTGGNLTDTELRHVQDYAEYGKLSVATQVTDNRSWLGDNEEAIEHSLASMSKEERDRYALGKRIANNQTLETPLSESDKQKALDYYTKTHEQLKAAAGKWFSGDSQINELAKWEDMITQKGGSLVTQLANHRGNIYDSSMQDVISTVENMSQEDWDRLKNDPAQIGKIEQVLKTYLSQEEFDRTMKVITDKKNATSYDASKQERRPVLDAIEDNKRWYNNDEAAIYKTLENMTDNERAQYKRASEPGASDADKKFKDDLDAKLKQSLDPSEQKVAFGLLEQVQRGEKPQMGILDKLNLQASYFDSDEAQVIRDIQGAFDKDPKMRDRITNPQTPDDKAFSENFKDAARRAMGSSDYEKYAKPLIETGKLSIELQMDLNNGVFNDDEQGAYQDIQRASAAERQRIITDKRFQERVMGFLSEDERKVALASMEQGEMRPEDKLRSYQLGLGTSEAEIRETLAALNDRTQLKSEGKTEAEIDQVIQQRIQKVRDEYARKYGSDLSADLVSELGGKDQRQALRQVNGRDARSEFLYALNDAATTRSGFGSGFVDRAWDGTGYQLDNEVNQLAAKMVEDPAKMREYVDNVYKMVDMHASSKEALADAVVDTAIAAGAVGGAFFTGGVSLSLLAYTGAAAAVFKVGAKGAIMGGDYDWGSSQVALDGATGFADGFTTFLGAGVATSAADKVLFLGGRHLLKEGGEAALKRGAATLVKEGLAQGGKITDEAIGILAKQISKEGQEQAVAQMLKKSIAESMEEQSRTFLKQLIKSTPDNVLAGMAGGGLSGTMRAGAEARDFKEFMQMAATSTAFGGLGGGVGTWVLAPGMHVAGKGWTAASPYVRSAASTLEDLGARAKVAVRGTPDANLPAQRVVPHEDGTFVRARMDEPVVEQPVVPGRDGVEPMRVANEPVVDANPSVVRRTETPDEKVKPKEDAEAPPTRREGEGEQLRPTTDAPSGLMRPDELKEFAEQISAKFGNRPITKESFNDLFNGDYTIDGVTRKLTADEQKIVRELMEQSGPNMSNKAINQRMEALREQAEKIDGWSWRNRSRGFTEESGPPTATVFTLDGASDGNGLAHLFRANSGLDVDVRILTGAELLRIKEAAVKIKAAEDAIAKFTKEAAGDLDAVLPGKKLTTRELIQKQQDSINSLREEYNLNNVMFFDNIANATPEQRQILSSVKNLLVADMDGFTRGPNIYDLSIAQMTGNNGAVKDKIGQMLGEINRLKAAEGISDSDAAAKLLREQYAKTVKEQFDNAHVVNSNEVTGGRVARDLTADTARLHGANDYQTDALYRQIFEPQATPQQIENFLGKMNAEQQRLAARLLMEGTQVNTYADMMTQAAQLHKKILETVPGGDPKNMLIITGLEAGGGSSYMINNLYGKVNGLTPENFVSMNDIRALARYKSLKNVPDSLKPLYESLKTKRLVFIDDYAMSGHQIPKLLDQNQKNVFSVLQSRFMEDGKPLIQDITVGTLGRHDVPGGKNPWTNQADYPNLFPADGKPHLNVKVVDSPSTYLPLNHPNNRFYNSLTPHEQDVLTTMMSNSMYRFSDVRSALILPYGGPNNNIPWIQAFIESPTGLGLPRRFRNHDWTPVIDGTGPVPVPRD